MRKIKVTISRELSSSKVKIETTEDYIEDFQLEMIRRNKFSLLAKVDCYQIDGKSNFIYDVTNMVSMKKVFEGQKLDYDKLSNMIKELTDGIELLKSYLLSPHSLILDPALIFRKGEHWVFLYLPNKKTTIEKSFHDLTEFFVRIIDYQEEKGIRLASLLHKETLQENFSLEDIWRKTHEILGDEDDDFSYEMTTDGKMSKNVIKEKPERFLFSRKVKKKRKIGKKSSEKSVHGRWGNWEDLLIDGQS